MIEDTWHRAEKCSSERREFVNLIIYHNDTACRPSPLTRFTHRDVTNSFTQLPTVDSHFLNNTGIG